MQHKPFMEYASSYALYNWRLEDPAKGMEYANLRLVRAFEFGLDPKSSEAGFVLTHVDMVRFSGGLVRGEYAVFWALHEPASLWHSLKGSSLERLPKTGGSLSWNILSTFGRGMLTPRR